MTRLKRKYDVPRRVGPAWQTAGAATAAAVEQETYDVPPTRSGATGDLCEPLELRAEETYDFPPPPNGTEGHQRHV